MANETSSRQSTIEIRRAWRLGNPDLARDAIAFWRRLDLLPEGAVLQTRVDALCVLAYRDGQVAGVASAFLEYQAALRARLAMFRCAVAPEHRKGPVLGALAESSRLLLKDWARAHPEEKIKGMGTVTEAAGADSMRLNPIVRHKDLRLILFGWSPEGFPMRVAWFQGARLEAHDAPAPRRK